ncbi:hypothetical protein WJX84_007510 [Apatococcus fuscideae]|uniref:protein-serine/threonine phosphatase n=1 Tax=Apatococcus fuscideae TaxID=2026836 RepID=A0AAW1RYG9_9CHLO
MGCVQSRAECFNAKSKHLASLKSCGSSFRQQLSDKKLISPTSGKHLEAGAEPLATVFHSSFGNSSLVSTTDSEGVACKDCIKAQQPCEGNNCPDDDGQLLGLSPEQLDATPVACVASGLTNIGFGTFKKENQDDFFMEANFFGGKPGRSLFAVFDGHGTNGMHVAKACKTYSPNAIAQSLAAAENEGTNLDCPDRVTQAINTAFDNVDKYLKTEVKINLDSSGTTASMVFQQGQHLWVASCGDSRVILCSRRASASGKSHWHVEPLTHDHRVTCPKEAARLRTCGGRVCPKTLPCGRSIGPARLWLKDLPFPGLCLSRSFGDAVAATIGCTSKPEVLHRKLQPFQDAFLVLATDGIWDVLKNEQVCEIVTESSDPDAAVQTMLEQALEAWEDRIASDNISMVVVKLDWGAEEPETTCSSTSADISAEASTIAEQDLRTRSPP